MMMLLIIPYWINEILRAFAFRVLFGTGGVINGALGYLVLPTDLIPDVIPGIGYGDDWGALVAALGTVSAYIKDEHKNKAAAQVARLFGGVATGPPPEFIE